MHVTRNARQFGRFVVYKVLPIFLLCATFFSGCNERGAFDLVAEQAPAAQTETVFVVTDRAPVADPAERFGDSRDETLRYARAKVSIPPVHQPGRIEWPVTAAPDPTRYFVLQDIRSYDRKAAFFGDLRRAMDGRSREVVLFVHGFNVNTPEAVYRVAQISHDFDSDDPVVLYSWPSAGHPAAYVYDRDSVNFSRDGLEEVLLTLTRDQGMRVFILAHSMGTQLVMETLRQISIGGRGNALNRVSGIALFSPDIDDEVFLRQAERIRPLPRPFVIFISRKDRALDLSALLTGKQERLGSISDPEMLEDLSIQVIDLTELTEGGLGHSTAFSSPLAIEMIQRLRRESGLFQ